MLLLAIIVMADGFFGTQVAPLNLAGVLPWIHWRALSVIALLVVGNLFCMACPFTFVRDLGRKVLPANVRWPAKLRNKWLAAMLIVCYLCAYELFGLWNSPWLTAWIIAGYFVAALMIDGIFRGASFCKYVCPIGQFNFISSLVSPREVRVRSQKVCKTCQTYDCIRGNERARGCELYLFQPKKESNLDCTFCLDCVKACPSQNVALLPVLPAATVVKDTYRSSIGKLSRRIDFAALALVIVFGAFVNAAAMTGPVMIWEHHLHAQLGPAAMPWIVAGFILAGAVALPLALSVVGVHRFAFALVPIGFSMWLAHFLYHLAGLTTSLQIIILDAGLLLTLYAGWRSLTRARELSFFGAIACGLYAAGIWILLQPMQMRGMM
jgi:ferredoxin